MSLACEIASRVASRPIKHKACLNAIHPSPRLIIDHINRIFEILLCSFQYLTPYLHAEHEHDEDCKGSE